MNQKYNTNNLFNRASAKGQIGAKSIEIYFSNIFSCQERAQAIANLERMLE